MPDPMTAPSDPTSAADATPAAPVLAYATLAADGLPEWHAQAEALIDHRAPLKHLRPFFTKSDDAVRYFAKSLQRRHTPDTAGDTCIACGGKTTDQWVVCAWKARGVPHFMEIRVSSEPMAEFVTCHAICAACGDRWLNRTGWNRFWTITRWSWGVSLLGLIGLIIAGNVMHGRGSFFGIAIPGCYIVGLLLSWIGTATFRWRTPQPIRRLVPRRRVQLLAATLHPQNPGDPPYGPPISTSIRSDGQSPPV